MTDAVDPIAPMLAVLLQREGGYVDHRDDRGGPTNWGITDAVARAHGWTGSMRNLPRSLALAIYRQRYWQQPGFEAVAAHSSRVAAELFDIGVNMGPGVAAFMLQRSLNALNRNQRDWPDIVPDRVVGPDTLAALARLLAVRGSDGEAVLLKALNALKGARYIELAEARAANESFLYGWLAHRVA
ncbi:glycoside hydrolase family 108 protein [Polymorphobacter sp.]|uniref:glycoside hydrolase family 108 protein n=1 Tax=Polymorphobacter sp. TaxID=1909290 RepID=UPI003F71BCDD